MFYHIDLSLCSFICKMGITITPLPVLLQGIYNEVCKVPTLFKRLQCFFHRFSLSYALLALHCHTLHSTPNDLIPMRQPVTFPEFPQGGRFKKICLATYIHSAESGDSTKSGDSRWKLLTSLYLKIFIVKCRGREAHKCSVTNISVEISTAHSTIARKPSGLLHFSYLHSPPFCPLCE